MPKTANTLHQPDRMMKKQVNSPWEECNEALASSCIDVQMFFCFSFSESPVVFSRPDSASFASAIKQTGNSGRSWECLAWVFWSAKHRGSLITYEETNLLSKLLKILHMQVIFSGTLIQFTISKRSMMKSVYQTLYLLWFDCVIKSELFLY